jgi:uncharacterized protein with PQ loop repeat
MQHTEMIGWLSSVVLVITISWQIYSQWRTRESAGVSPWLFIGQGVASLGFLGYSILIRNWVFVFTNGLLIVETVVGLTVLLLHRRRNDQSSEESAGSIEVT